MKDEKNKPKIEKECVIGTLPDEFAEAYDNHRYVSFMAVKTETGYVVKGRLFEDNRLTKEEKILYYKKHMDKYTKEKEELKEKLSKLLVLEKDVKELTKADAKISKFKKDISDLDEKIIKWDKKLKAI